MNAIWLFLYLGCLIRLLTLYRLDLNKPATLLLLPFLVQPWLAGLCRRQPWLLRQAVLRGAGLLALATALALARSLNLGFWETRHLGMAALGALLGLSLALVAQSQPRASSGPGLWIWIAFWEFAGSWHPVLTLVGAGLAAFLAAFGTWPESRPATPSVHRLSPVWTLALLGLVLPKPWFDYQFEGTWAGGMAVFALAAGLASLAAFRERLDRLPSAWPLTLLALAFFIYPSAWILSWAAAVGLLWGLIWSRLPETMPLSRAGLGFAFGLLLSYALHSNLGIPFLRRLLWWGS